jgi:hypothetical protein
MQRIGSPRFSVPNLLDSNLSQSSCQQIQQNFQGLRQPNHLDYPIVYLIHLEEQSFASGTLDQNLCLSSPRTSYPVIWERSPVDFFSAGLEGNGHTFSSSETPYLPCMYTDVVSGSSYDSTSGRSGAYGSGWEYSEDKSTGQRRGRKAQKMRIPSPSCDGTDIGPMHYSPSQRIKCPIETLGDKCAQSFARTEHLRRHIRSKHSSFRVSCKVPRCTKSFSRSDNLYDHYCTHIDVEKPGRNRRLSLYELGQILGSQDIGIFHILKRRVEQPRKPIRRRHRKS